MNTRVLRVRKLIRLMQLFFLILTIIADISFFRFGILYGFYRTIVSLIPLTATILILDSILQGSKKSIYSLCFFLILGIGFSAYIIASGKNDILVVSITSLLGLIYLIQLLYLLFSTDIKSFHNYNNEIKSLEWLWSWNGKCIGYKKDNFLWTHTGKAIGKFFDNEIYSSEGKYLGELYSNGRLATDKTKTDKSKEPFAFPEDMNKFEKLQDISALRLYPNFKDFSIEVV